jgi:hypothetical protein
VLLSNDPNSPELEQLERIFERRLSLDTFDPSTAEADDLRDRIRFRSAKNGTFQDSTPIGSRTFGRGVTASFIIVANSDGQVDRVLFTHRELSDGLRTVRSLAGAAGLLELREILGFMNSESRLPERPSQCTASEIREDNAGWTIKGIEVRSNCAALRRRDFRIERSGKVTLLSDVEAWSLFSGYTCVD